MPGSRPVSIDPNAPTRRGRPPQISAADILEAVTARLGAEWTIASIASELGVTDSAIYRYFPTRKALLSAVADRIIAAQPTPQYDGDWRALLTQLGRGWYTVYESYPAFLDLDTWGDASSTSGITMIERALDELERAGFQLSDGLCVISAITAIAREYARLAALSGRTDLTPTMWDANAFPAMSRALAAAPATALEGFERTLAIVVEGAGHYLPTARTPRRPRPKARAKG